MFIAWNAYTVTETIGLGLLSEQCNWWWQLYCGLKAIVIVNLCEYDMAVNCAINFLWILRFSKLCSHFFTFWLWSSSGCKHCNSSLVRSVICPKGHLSKKYGHRLGLWLGLGLRLRLELVKVRAMVRVRVRFSVKNKNLHNYISDKWQMTLRTNDP